MKNIVISLLILFSFDACIENSIQEPVTIKSEEYNKFSYQVDTILIMTPGTIREFPYLFPSFNYSDPIFAGLDERTNLITIYDSETLSIKDTIQLYYTGPHAIQGNMVGSIWYHNPDSIFILQHVPNRLMIVNSKAEITWEKNLKDIFQSKSEINGLFAYGLFDRVGLYYNDDKVYFALRQNRARQDFLAPMIGYYDFENNDIHTIDIHYPEFYTMNQNVGIYKFPGITWLKNSIIIVLPHSPEIFIYDYKGKLQKHIEKIPGFNVGQIPKPGESSQSHLMNNPIYRIVQPIQNGDYFLFQTQKNTPNNPDSEIYKSTVLFNRDFTKFSTVDINVKPISFGGEYFYYPIPPEQSEYQLMERYRIEME